MVVVVACTPPVVEVVEDADGDVVVVVTLDAGGVVLVVLLLVVVLLVDVDEVGDEVVVVGDAGGAGEGVKTPLSVVPLPALPKMSASGFPEISSMAVMKSKARAKTMPTVAAMAPQENPSGAPDRRGPGRPGGSVVARRCSVAGASAAAEISRRAVSLAGADAISTVSAAPTPSGAGRPTTSVGADASCDDDVAPLAPVPPSLRSNVAVSGARTTTCLTAS